MPDDIGRKIDALGKRRQTALQDVAIAAKAVLPVLRDHKLDNTAAVLSEKLFQLEAIEQEMRDLVQADPTAFVDALLDRLSSRR